MGIRDDIRARVKACPNISRDEYLHFIGEMCQRYGLSRIEFQNKLSDMKRQKHDPIPRNWGRLSSAPIAGVIPDIVPIIEPETEKRDYPTGLDGFRELFDKSRRIPRRIQEQIDIHLKAVTWSYDEDFRRICGVNVEDWKRFREQFRHLILTAEGRQVWGHPDHIAEMRRIVS